MAGRRPLTAVRLGGTSRSRLTAGKVVRVGTSVAERTPTVPAGRRPDLRSAIRFAFAVCGAALLCFVLWQTRSDKLTGPIDIVGYPTFENYDYTTSFTAYRLVTYLFGPLAIGLYALLYWRGPLRVPAGIRSPEPIALVPVSRRRPAAVGPDRAGTDSADTRSATYRPGSILAPLWRLIPPAIFVCLVVSTGSRTGRVDLWGIASAVTYVLGVLALAVLGRWGQLWWSVRGDRTIGPWSIIEWLAAVNAAAGVAAAVGGIYLLSANSKMWTTDGTVRIWSWMPWWLALTVTTLGWARLGRQLRRGRSPVRLERQLRTAFLGSAAMYLLTASFPGPVQTFQGFDDAQSLVGAELLSHGYFPWRDFQFVHGLFYDALRSTFAFHVFEPTQWGSEAGTMLVITPVAWVAVYLLTVWALPRGSVLVLAPLALAAWGGFALDIRFIAVPLVFLLLGRAIASPRPFWTIGLTAALFANAVLVPETAYQVLAVASVLLAADLVHRRPNHSWWRNLRRTGCFLAAGAVLSAGWAGYLASQHALTAFLQYYLIFGPGHDAAGAHPIAPGQPPAGVSVFSRATFAVVVTLVVLTAWSCAWRLRGRHSWTPLAWVTVAAAITAGLYGEKALGRPDDAHFQQAISVGLPLLVLSMAAAVPGIDNFVTRRLARGQAGRPAGTRFAQSASAMALLVTVVSAPSIIPHLWQAPQKFHAESSAPPVGTRLGYAQPNAISPGLLSDLRTVLDTYAGDSPVFDMTNSLGYYYFLLQRRPSTQFVHVSMAIPEYAQSLLVSQLMQARPRVVIFDSNYIGVSEWDGIRNAVRHFQVSQYLLDGWTPILTTHGVMFMLRNDLVPKRPPLPHLTMPAQTTDLYNSRGPCNWGDAASFLTSSPSGPSLTTSAQPMPGGRRVSVTGWAVDPTARRAARQVVFTAGPTVAAVLPVDTARPDVTAAADFPAASHSGFDGAFTTAATTPLTAYALEADGALHLLPGSDQAAGPVMTKLRMPDGTSAPISATPASGHLEVATSVPVRLTRLTVPGSTPLATFPLATFAAAGPIGSAQLTLSDVLDPFGRPGGHDIEATTLPLTGSAMSVRVGSCLPWHGYSARTLYLTQYGGTPVTRVTLSGVQDQRAAG